MSKRNNFGNLLVASGLLNSYKISSRLNKKWLSYEPKTIFGIRSKFDSNRYINSSNINIFERDQLNMKDISLKVNLKIELV